MDFGAYGILLSVFHLIPIFLMIVAAIVILAWVATGVRFLLYALRGGGRGPGSRNGPNGGTPHGRNDGRG